MSFHRPPPMGNMGFGFQGPPPMRGMMMGNRGPPPPMNRPPMTNGPPMMPRPHIVPRPNLPQQMVNKAKLVPQEIGDVEDGEIAKPPVTTVFVGSISERAPDNMIRTLLQRCGNIVSWKRVQGADGKLQAFGFCEFEIPEATMRCMRLLNEWPIADKKLVVKVDDKTKAMLEEYEKTHVTEEDEVKREDRLALAALDAVMREFAAELRRTAPPQQSQLPRHPREQFGVVSSGPKADEGLDGVVKDEDAKNLISREINRFREAYKDDEVVTEIKPGTRDGKSKPDKPSESSRRRESPERRSRVEKERSGRNEKTERAGDRDRKMAGEEKEDRLARSRRSRSRSKGRDERRLERSRSPRKREDPEEDADERYERLRLERQLRDKEQAYQERLKNWEVRERKKIREFERDRQRSEERKAEEKKEARRLREFLEDYEDDRDDSKYYKSHALNRRMKEREKEAEADARDRHKEKEELEELRKKLVEEGHPDPDSEINRRQNPSKAVVVIADSPEQAPPDMQEDGLRENHVDDSSYTHTNSVPQDSTDNGYISHNSNTSSSMSAEKLEMQKRKRLTVKDVFNNEDDKSEGRKGRPLVPLDYEAKKPAELTVEDKRAAIKQLIERIPTDKLELFAWPLDWDQVDKTLLDSRIKPWVNKKISEYIGEEEATLTEFICQKVMGRSSAQSILTDVAMVLDDEAQTFVMKMWRLLVYETEAKKAGLVK